MDSGPRLPFLCLLSLGPRSRWSEWHLLGKRLSCVWVLSLRKIVIGKRYKENDVVSGGNDNSERNKGHLGTASQRSLDILSRPRGRAAEGRTRKE